MRLFFIAIMGMLMSSNSFGQVYDFDWAQTINGGGSFPDVIRSIEVDQFGNIYGNGNVSGTVDFDPDSNVSLLSNQNGSFFMFKNSNSGEYIWAHDLPDIGNFYITNNDESDLYVASGFWNSVDIDHGSGTQMISPIGFRELLFLKYDSIGNYLWHKQIVAPTYTPPGQNPRNSKISPNGIVNIDNNEFAIYGTLLGNADLDGDSGIYMINSSWYEFFISYYDDMGNFKKAMSIDVLNDSSESFCYDLEIDDSGNIYFFGSYKGQIDLDPGSDSMILSSNSNTYKMLFCKYDSSFNPIFHAEFDGYPLSYLRMGIDDFGNIILAGSFTDTMDFDPDSSEYLLVADGDNDVFVMSLDSVGSLNWAHRFGGPDGTNIFGGWARDQLRDMKIDKNSNIVFCGQFYDTVDFDPGPNTQYLNSGQETYTGFVCVLDRGGNYVWAGQLGEHGIRPGTLATDQNNNIFVGGHYFYSGDINPGLDTFMIHYNEASHVESDMFWMKLKNTNSVGFEKQFAQEIKIYPNPNSGLFRIDVPNLEGPINMLNLIDFQGRIIQRIEINRTSQIANLKDLSPGIYFYELKGQENLYRGKIVIH